MDNHHLVKAAVFAALLGAGASMHAAGITINSGDLVLGFQDATNSIQFDLGNVSTLNLTALNGATTDLGYNVNTALSYAGGDGRATGYGATWASTSGISWTVAGADASNFYAGMAQTSPSSTIASGAAIPNSTLVMAGDTTAAQSAIATMTTTMHTEPASVQLKAGGSTILAAKYLNTDPASINIIDPAGTTGVAFGAFQNASLMNTSVTSTTTGTAGLLNGKTYSAIDLYSFTGPSGNVTDTFLGTLELTTGGEVYFTSALSAIPEPSTYAMILGVFALGFVMLRRRHQVTA
jgi:hypothetical protein